jgi:hypothetical protein
MHGRRDEGLLISGYAVLRSRESDIGIMDRGPNEDGGGMNT